METYEKNYHKYHKYTDSADLMLNEVIVQRYKREIENNNKKNIYYKSLIDYMMYMRSQMGDTEYPILTESGFSAMTDVDGIKTPEFVISSNSLYYSKDFKTSELTFLEFKQTRKIKVYKHWEQAILGDISERVFKGDAEQLAMINGLRREVNTLLDIAKGSKVVVALTMDKTIIGEGYETKFFQYDYDTKEMKYLTTKNRKEDFKNTLKHLTK